MYRFFIEEHQIQEEYIYIEGEDFNHMKNVLRMKEGEHIYISTGKDLEYECEIEGFEESRVKARIVDVHGMETELSTKLVLFQGIPKGDKMEFIIQKAVELGVSEIVPVAMKRCVVKLDAKKAAKKVTRWNAIAHSAAKQSKRGIIPEVSEVKSYTEALCYARELDEILVPYEEEKGIQYSKELVKQARNHKSIGIFIGPEGGFDGDEIQKVCEIGGKTLTLGKRILRTETAGMTMLSILMFELEEE
ncbi:MAG: 16S rRNA (uracil(1498)-N(3))-methyltransferase [Anaerostipes sp.]|jgi:16S rRNA (uracil1498-N3)-methyltransferase|nr:16S rRNA (uracil(1498)-N(3))-methyltransferase [Anaerostipes sp.]MDD3745419.1 16S rRNA (uracil(1498)-N(3))-methyltransferase [Anaerostipes sp.]